MLRIAPEHLSVRGRLKLARGDDENVLWIFRVTLMWWFVALLALWSLPVLAHRYARQRVPHHVWRNTGFALGLIISPASFGTYGLYYRGAGLSRRPSARA